MFHEEEFQGFFIDFILCDERERAISHKSQFFFLLSIAGLIAATYLVCYVAPLAVYVVYFNSKDSSGFSKKNHIIMELLPSTCILGLILDTVFYIFLTEENRRTVSALFCCCCSRGRRSTKNGAKRRDAIRNDLKRQERSPKPPHIP